MFAHIISVLYRMSDLLQKLTVLPLRTAHLLIEKIPNRLVQVKLVIMSIDFFIVSKWQRTKLKFNIDHFLEPIFL